MGHSTPRSVSTWATPVAALDQSDSFIYPLRLGPHDPLPGLACGTGLSALMMDREAARWPWPCCSRRRQALSWQCFPKAFSTSLIESAPPFLTAKTRGYAHNAALGSVRYDFSPARRGSCNQVLPSAAVDPTTFIAW